MLLRLPQSRGSKLMLSQSSFCQLPELNHQGWLGGFVVWRSNAFSAHRHPEEFVSLDIPQMLILRFRLVVEDSSRLVDLLVNLGRQAPKQIVKNMARGFLLKNSPWIILEWFVQLGNNTTYPWSFRCPFLLVVGDSQWDQSSNFHLLLSGVVGAWGGIP